MKMIKGLLNELKDVNSSETTNGNNSGAQQKLVDALTEILSKNKERAFRFIRHK